jgi:integrase/recombinase XerD
MKYKIYIYPIKYNIMQQSKYTLTPEDFLSRKERSTILRTCRERAEIDIIKGRITWPVRYMLVDLSLFSGLRVSEMTKLKIKDLYLPASDPYIIVRHGKGDKERTVYIDNKLAGHLRWFIDYKEKTLRQSIEADSPLFSGQGGKQCPTITLMKSFKMAVSTAKLRETLSLHKCRHSYASYLLHDTGNLRYVQKQLGHSDIGMTSLYADILPEENGTLANKIVRDDE